MADRPTRTWNEIRRQRPLNESRVATYKRLMDAEVRLEGVRRRRGIHQATIAEALETSESDASKPEDDVYVSTLARYVAALGGYLEVRAVFGDETITLVREPADSTTE
jgi:hypothetical protein